MVTPVHDFFLHPTWPLPMEPWPFNKALWDSRGWIALFQINFSKGFFFSTQYRCPFPGGQCGESHGLEGDVTSLTGENSRVMTFCPSLRQSSRANHFFRKFRFLSALFDNCAQSIPLYFCPFIR